MYSRGFAIGSCRRNAACVHVQETERERESVSRNFVVPRGGGGGGEKSCGVKKNVGGMRYTDTVTICYIWLIDKAAYTTILLSREIEVDR